MAVDNPKAAKLSKYLDSVIHGKRDLTPHDNALFVEALCAAPDPATCLSKLVTSDKGLVCLQACMRYTLTPAFFNGPATALLRYFSTPELATIGGGSLLQKAVNSIADPPIFWHPYRKAFIEGQLDPAAQVCFAWLLLQLILLPTDFGEHVDLEQDSAILAGLLSSPHREVRSIAERIKHVVATCRVGASIDLAYGPGGRHDNDSDNFRDISILPTEDELVCQEKPFLRPSTILDDPDTEDNRVAIHLDNQFRLLREDMLYEIREELQIALGRKKGTHRGFMVEGFTVENMHHTLSSSDRKCKWGITLKCRYDLWQFKKCSNPQDRKTYVDEDSKFFQHQSMACLIIDGEIVAFPTINRDEELLAHKPPIVVLQFEGEKSALRALMKLRTAQHIKLLQINTAVFAYEPVLRALQEQRVLPLAEELLFWKEGSIMTSPTTQPEQIVQSVKVDGGQNLQCLLKTTRRIELDDAQAASLLSGLTQKLSLIQGPPGTGKSFIGALLAKVLHDFSAETILVVCYTNHALDQFLEDLLDIGIPGSSVVRLGGKSTARTAPLALQNQTKTVRGRRAQADWDEIHALKASSERLSNSLALSFQAYKSFKPQHRDVLEHLHFDHPDHFEAFRVPESEDGMQSVGKKGRTAGPDYLLDRWFKGENAGIFSKAAHVLEASEIWNLPRELRRAQVDNWVQEMLRDHVELLCTTGTDYNLCQTQIDSRFRDKEAMILRSKRIIGCTTTAAAKYREEISAARPGVLLVEEAGEIQESHILTALSPEIKQLILIGDHKQLRPKVNNYLLTVEKGEGYDLNRSLFERLIIKGYPHETLKAQHRMRPEISALVRHLTYPDLVDATKTHNRPNLRGVRDNVVFISHDKPEDDIGRLEERSEMSGKSSKQNKHEVEMVLKIVRYLGQQGYGTDKMVILTPYLGQLRALQEALKKDNDPVLNDLDYHDLVRAGLMCASAAKVAKKPLRLATVDNYQGEESDIVIVSLTRSNQTNDIGFMSAFERVTVLLSRARDALIMIGNAHTFKHARKGNEVWTTLLDLLHRNRHVYDGLPGKCEQHTDRAVLLKCPEDFDKECPDGGCLKPCGVMLSCGLHACPSRCHQLSDHSKMPCGHIIYSNCPKGHRQQWKCQKGPPGSCHICDREQKLAEKTQQEEFTLQQKRDFEQQAHAQRMAELDAQMTRQRHGRREARLTEERRNAIEQKQKDLQEATRQAAQCCSGASNMKTSQSPTPAVPKAEPSPSTKAKIGASPQFTEPTTASRRCISPVKSVAREQWCHQKEVEEATNDAIDAIMEMTGLESVKQQVLKIKDKVDTAKRQNSSLKRERFNVSMLGNPGTGKTTVARHYGRFLASLQIIPGHMFIETTGSRLANEGVPGAKMQLEKVLNAGGGTIFVDEAYQLTSDHNISGGQVLDFLLAEMENNVGTVCFIFAGYDKEMEKFFEHNPGLTSRVPYILHFEDYDDSELMAMLESLIEKQYGGRMKIDNEDGIRGLYGRIAVRRLGRGRGRKGFGNARALENIFSKIRERQAERITKERRQGHQPDDFLFVKEDLIGPDPSRVKAQSIAWKNLQAMIGLGAVKESITNLFSIVASNYARELKEKAPYQVCLNRVFLGSPGTGKTSVAKYYGQILSDLGLISNGKEVVVKNPSDFIGGYLGQSESQTKAILSNTVGKVLVIDEAYMLYGGERDPFKTAVIDTIVAEVQSVPGEDRCVLLLGYKDNMEDMFQNVNSGLSRRFAIEDAFHFEDYSDPELMQALELKLRQQDLTATDAAKNVAIDVLSRARNRPNFGNIGEVENLLSKAKVHYQSRQASMPLEERSVDAPFEPQDFDPDYDRSDHAATNLAKIFEDVVGCEDIIDKLGKWQNMARNMKAMGKEGKEIRENIPMNFVFKGPPGTGKTTTARKMGQVYYDMGLLSSTDVIECSASDLVGQYVGHTGPKTKRLLEKALGRVLFVDEAYRLGEGSFAKEAMDELVGILTQEAFRTKLVVILAGYDHEMNSLMRVNSGLSSRFPEEIIFRNIPPAKCLEVLKQLFRKHSVRLKALEEPSSADYKRMMGLIKELSLLPSWGNARDVETLSKEMMAIVFTTISLPSGIPSGKATNFLTLDSKDAIACLERMLSGRRERSANLPTPSHPAQEMQQLLHEHGAPSRPVTHTTISTQNRQEPTPAFPPLKNNLEEDVQHRLTLEGRDTGVTDPVWLELQVAKQIAEDVERRNKEVLQRLQQDLEEALEREEVARMLAKQLAEAEADNDERGRREEEAGIRELAAKAARARIAAVLNEQEKKRKEEARVQSKIREMGVCVQGYQWIKQTSGYRCAGGSHFIDNATLGI